MDSDFSYLDFPLVDEFDSGAILYRLYDNRIFHAIIKKGEKVTMEMTIEGYDFLNRNGAGKFYNLYEFQSFSDLDPEIRSWAAESSGNHYTHADAIVISNLAQKIIANFYLKFNKPAMPTRIFSSPEKAIDWLISEMEEKRESA